MMKKIKQIFMLLTISSSLFHSSALWVAAQELVISGNGAGAGSEVAIQSNSTTTISQSNSGEVVNTVDTQANTGGNETSGNSGDVAIQTGDIESFTKIQTSLNHSSVVNECCNGPEIKIEVNENGSDSTNNVSVTSNNQTTITVNQNATVGNNVSGTANTGHNTANNNGGNIYIGTGDIKAKSVVKTGPVNYVQIQGGLNGSGLNIDVSNNGDSSNNLVTLLLNDLANINVNHSANIYNKLDWDLNTGNNVANGNNWDVMIKTGDILLDLLIENGPVNVGGITWGCCDGGTPDGPDDPSDPDNEGNPPKGSGGGSQNGASISEILGIGQGPAVLGLSATGGLFDAPVYFWLGMFLITYGFKLLGENLPRIRFVKNGN